MGKLRPRYKQIARREPRARLDLAALLSLTVNIFAMGGYLQTIVQPLQPAVPSVTGIDRLTVVCMLAVVSWVCYGLIWGLIDRMFAWNFGPGTGDSLPGGWSAVALSLSVSIPLAVVPLLYQQLAQRPMVAEPHVNGMIWVAMLGAVAHVLMYGTSAAHPNGVRERIMPAGRRVSMGAGVLCEVAYGVLFFTLMIVPYRLVVDAQTSWWNVLIVRTALPALVFVSIMTTLILLVPAVVNDPKWAGARGIIGAGAMMFALCGGLFL